MEKGDVLFNVPGSAGVRDIVKRGADVLKGIVWGQSASEDLAVYHHGWIDVMTPVPPFLCELGISHVVIL